MGILEFEFEFLDFMKRATQKGAIRRLTPDSPKSQGYYGVIFDETLVVAPLGDTQGRIFYNGCEVIGPDIHLPALFEFYYHVKDNINILIKKGGKNDKKNKNEKNTTL